MKLGILETGRPPEGLESHGAYARMFERLLGPGFDYVAYSVIDGVLPEAVDQADAWLVTGSRFGVYDDAPWIRHLEAFLRTAMADHVPVVGICFGHQLLARVQGAEVAKAEAGWGVGPHDYEVVARPDWLGDTGDRFRLNAMHQDQVLTLPPGATLVARSDFCPFAVLTYADRAMSIQAHPEFDNAYERALIAKRRGVVIPSERADAALAALDGAGETAPDAGKAAAWIRTFLRQAVAGHIDC